MRPVDIERLLMRRPFNVLRFVVTDGSVYEIRHPDSAVMTRSQIELSAGWSSDDVREPSIYLSLLHIVRIEELPPQPPPTANGPPA